MMLYPPFLTESFTEGVARLNDPRGRGFQRWSLLPGMLFGAAGTWWPSRNMVRPRPHEGLDLYSFIDTRGTEGILTPGTMIPVLARGEVVALFADFLGQSILVAHDPEQEGARLHSIYAHVTPEPGVVVGHHCRGAEAIARIAPSRMEGVPAHLHLSTLWLMGSLDGEVTWPLLNTAPGVRLTDPMEFIGA